MRKLRTAVFIPIIALVIIGFSVSILADAATIDESSTSSITLNAVTLTEHSSYVTDVYFGIINLSVDDKNVAAVTTDTQGHVVVTAIGTGTTKVRYWFRSGASDGWTRATLPITVSGTSVSASAAVETGLVFPQSSVSLANGSNYTVTGITLNGTAVDASSLLWVASSGAVITVEANTGKVTAVGTGTAVLYAIDPATKAAANINLSVY
jgi:hypothetical protein